jgi:Secretion system C-terminal sorting domain
MKRKILFVFLLAVNYCWAQSPTNDCGTGGGSQLTVGGSCSTTSWDISTAIGSPALGSCGGTTPSGRDGWGWFTATATSTTVNYTNTNRDAVIYIYSGSCGSLTYMTCVNAVSGTGTETVTFATTIGNNYFVRVASTNTSGPGSTMVGNICVYSCTAPTNETPCSATNLAVPTSCTYASYNLPICAAASAVANPTCNNIAVNDIWYSATVPASGKLFITTTSGGMTNADMALYSATACAGVFTQLYCDDNTGPGSMPEIVATGLTAGTTVYIRVWARNNAQSGTFNMCIYDPCPSAPSNDGPCGATSLTVGATCSYSSYSLTTCATASGVANPSCNGTTVNDIWYSATVPASGKITFTTTSGGITDADMALYSAPLCSGAYTQLYCDDNTGPGSMPEIAATSLTVGSTVYLRVWARNNAQTGTFNLCAYEPCSVANDDPCGAAVLIPNPICNYSTYSNNCATATAGIPLPGCANYSGGDVWFAVTVPASGGLTVDTKQGTLTDIGMALYTATACGGTFTLVTCDDDASTNGFMSYISSTSLIAGDVVYIRVWDKNNNQTGTFDICVTDPCPNGIPANDLPCNAQQLTIGVTLFGDNGCATSINDPATPACWSAGSSNTIWYYVVAPPSGSIRMRTYLNTLINSQMALFSGTCSALTLVACNDDATACPGSTPVYHSEINASGLTPGQTYYVAVDGSANYMGTFNIAATDGSAFSPIPQQDCIYPTLICNQITPVGNPGFTGAGNVCDYTTPYSCYGGGERNSVWYYFNITVNGTLAFDIIPTVSSTDYDYMLFNASGLPFGTICSQISAQTTIPVRCNFSGTTGTTGLTPPATGTHENASGPNDCSTLAVTAGQTFLLLITNYSNNNTGFSIDFTSGSPLSYSSTPTSVIWSGGIDNDWFKPGNWGGCAIPSCTIDAIVVNGPINQPVINGSGAVAKSLTINPGANLSIQGNNTLQLCGDYTNNGDLNANAASTILFGTGNAIQNINGNLVNLSQFPNVRIQKSGGQVNLNQNIDIAGNFAVQSTTSIFNINGKYLTLDGNFFNNNGSTTFINPAGSTFEFDGLGAQVFNNGAGSLLLGSVRMDNKSTGVTLSGSTSSINVGATGTLDLTTGVFITAANNEVNVTNTTPSAVNSGNVNSYVRGRLRRSIGTTTGNYYFPVGNAAYGYELAEINYTIAPTSGYTLLSTFNSWGAVPNGPVSSDCSGKNYALNPALNHGYWSINASVSPASGTYNVTLNNLGYNNSSGSFWTIMKRSPSVSGPWALEGTCNISSTAATTIREGLTGFSDFASIQWTNPLPIQLLSFNVEKSGKEALCKWTTVSEENNDYFTIERSIDKINAEAIGKVNGAGNSSEVLHYTFTDNSPHSGLSYYRIRQTDFNGKTTASSWKSIDFAVAPQHLALFPNPASKYINCSFKADEKGLIEISITDITQKELLKYRTEMASGQNRIPVNIESIPDGVYFIRLKNADAYSGYFELNSKFIKGKKQ